MDDMNIEPRADVEAQLATGKTAFYIVQRCDEMPASYYPYDIRRRITIIACQKCQEPCWLDPKSYLLGTIIRCLRCLQESAAFFIPGATQEQVDEIERLLRERYGE